MSTCQLFGLGPCLGAAVTAIQLLTNEEVHTLSQFLYCTLLSNQSVCNNASTHWVQNEFVESAEVVVDINTYKYPLPDSYI